MRSDERTGQVGKQVGLKYLLIHDAKLEDEIGFAWL